MLKALTQRPRFADHNRETSMPPSGTARLTTRKNTLPRITGKNDENEPKYG